MSIVKTDSAGRVDLNNLEELLEAKPRSLVSLMHANNEVATLLPVKDVSRICRKYNAIFHTDMVQTFGHYEIDMQRIDIDFASCSAHKFHGPKGTGFLYINNEKVKISPMIYGGGQERNMRGGTENIHGIVGLTKAFDIANRNINADTEKIKTVKFYMAERLEAEFPDVEFVGESRTKGLYTVLNVLFPEIKGADMLLMNLDIEGIAASGGSACASGSNSRSHVLDALNISEKRPAIRFSFSKFNTKEEVDYCIKVLKKYIIQ